MPGTRIVQIEQDILAQNNRYAEENRRWLGDRGMFALNLVSSPGSGKTTVLVRTITMLAGRLACAVVEGDQQTSRDADRVRATGAAAVQINTGKGCHLDARMVGLALTRLEPVDGSLVMIENVGNLVCPADYDLGEDLRVVLLSVTEGEDKPLKYPPLFHSAQVAIITKTDMAAAAGFNRDLALINLQRVSHHAKIFELSAKTGDGMKVWLDFLAQQRKVV
jgi:hydrogenase nickel incorporation protein HypB